MVAPAAMQAGVMRVNPQACARGLLFMVQTPKPESLSALIMFAAAGPERKRVTV
jgi:hypothetical protein